jgi:hypothetical protein
MSDYRAIAAATRTLQNMLQPAVNAAVPGATVRTQRPERTPNVTSSGEVSIYLYQISPNPAFRNAELPVRRSDGSLIRRPQVALDLHYLISFYGDEAKLVPQLLLGTVVSLLHSQPYPSLDDIPGGPSGSEGAELTGTGLQHQADRLRFVPLPLSHDELSKLWSIFFQVPYTLSVGYLCSVILIEPDLVPQPVLPIRRAILAVRPGQPPQIEMISPQVIAAGREASIQVRGRNLASEGMKVRVGGVAALPSSISSAALVVPVPAAVPAGVQTVQVTTAAGLESNRAAFVLQPTLVEIAYSAEPPAVTALVQPAPAPDQPVTLLLNELLPRGGHATPRQYAFGQATLGPGDTVARIPTPGLAPGAYLARVEVAGVSSALAVDTDPASQTFEQYVGPRLEVK